MKTITVKMSLDEHKSELEQSRNRGVISGQGKILDLFLDVLHGKFNENDEQWNFENPRIEDIKFITKALRAVYESNSNCNNEVTEESTE